MIPFRDNIRSRTTPFITKSLIVINALAFLYELSLGGRLDALLQVYAVIPSDVLAWPDNGKSLVQLAMPFVTSMFLHGGWMHLLGNMWYLWIFGDNVEDRLGHFRFLMFYLLSGFGAGLIHLGFNPESAVPTIGASGAIAGVLGAYLVTFPRAGVLTLVPLFVFIQIIEIPAWLVLGVWFLGQFLSGTASLAAANASAGGIAWWAHVGGFVIGILLMKMLEPAEGRPRVGFG